jgi:peptidyl-prolyl cis-trans isomerase D
MAVIGNIRKRGALIATIVFVALLAFVLGDLLFSGHSLFTSSQNVGEIAGTTIDIATFENEVQRTAYNIKIRRQTTSLDEETMEEIRAGVWEKMVNDIAFRPQYEGAGLGVSQEEVKYLLLSNDPDPIVVQYFTDPSTGRVYESMRDPVTGKLSPTAIKQYDDTLRKYQNLRQEFAAEWARWVEFQERLPEVRMRNKYINLIKKGLYVTTQQAKADHENLNRTVNFSYILKPYSDISDADVKITDKDRRKFYNENRYKYKQEPSRKLEYVIFDIKATEEDYETTRKEMENLAKQWSQIKEEKDDSLFVVSEDDDHWFDTSMYGKGQLPPQIDSIAHLSDKGTVLPIYLEGDVYHLVKVIDADTVPEVKARHILIKFPEGDSAKAKIKAKAKIDSIKTVIKNKKNFGEMAVKFSDDKGSASDSGNLGWFGRGRMVKEFDSACFAAKKGDMFVVLTKYGYHLVEIMDKNPAVRKTQHASIDRKVVPGTKTRNRVYDQASDFIYKYHNAFDKGVEEMNLVKRIADPLRESDKQIAGIENAREIIRWAFNAKVGDVSASPFYMQDKYVVTHLAEIREEGIASIEQKREEVEIGAIKAKKAKMILEEMKKLNVNKIEEYASKLNLKINSVEGATFTSYSIPNVGRELKLYGYLFTLKQGETSKPIAGETGVYVIRVDKITEASASQDYKQAKTQARNNYQYRAELEAIEALRKLANIKDNRAKFY